MWRIWAKRRKSHLECQAFDTTAADIDDRLRQIETNILRITFLSKRVEGVMSKVWLHHYFEHSISDILANDVADYCSIEHEGSASESTNRRTDVQA